MTVSFTDVFMTDEDLEEGTEVEACVLHNDVINQTVYLSLKSHLLEMDDMGKKKRSKVCEEPESVVYSLTLTTRALVLMSKIVFAFSHF